MYRGACSITIPGAKLPMLLMQSLCVCCQRRLAEERQLPERCWRAQFRVQQYVGLLAEE